MEKLAFVITLYTPSFGLFSPMSWVVYVGVWGQARYNIYHVYQPEGGGGEGKGMLQTTLDIF